MPPAFVPMLFSAALFLLPALAEAQTRRSSDLATNGSLSVEAIRLQSQSEKLLSLEQEQEAARKREANYVAQMVVLRGAAEGAKAVAAYCIGKMLSGGSCDTKEGVGIGVGAAVISAPESARIGRATAEIQNKAAARENETKRRLQVASRQLDAARAARLQAEAVATMNARKLAQLKAAVKAGKASKRALAVAQADAKADAQQVRFAAAAIGGSADSLGAVNRDQTKAQGRDAQSFRNAQATLSQEEKKTEAQYKALVKSINASAL